MNETKDCQPFPIQGEPGMDRTNHPACTVPEWLAKLAYSEYACKQGFKRIAERGGFGRAELVALIRGDYMKGIQKAQEDLDRLITSEEVR